MMKNIYEEEIKKKELEHKISIITKKRDQLFNQYFNNLYWIAP